MTACDTCAVRAHAICSALEPAELLVEVRFPFPSSEFRFFELGRSTLLRDAGFPLREVEKNGYVYPIFQVGLDYFRPMQHDDPIWVNTRFRGLDRVRVDFDYIITHAETQQVLCRGFTRHCATNLKGRPVAVDAITVGIHNHFPT